MSDAGRRAADEVEIRNLLARIAQLADEGSVEEYIECFTRDAVWGGAGFADRRGHASLLEGARERRSTGTAGPGTHTRHLVSTAVVDVAGDQATACSTFLFYRDTNAKPVLDRMGRYDDRFERTATGWKLSARMISQP